MTILDRANAFIGHEQEIDEGYETTMRRNAFIAGFKEALELVRKMREAWMDKEIVEMRIRFKKEEGLEITEEDNECYASAIIKTVFLEDEVDEYLKEMEV